MNLLKKIKDSLVDFFTMPALPTEEEARQQIYAARPLLSMMKGALYVRKETTTEIFGGGHWALMTIPYKVTSYYLEPIPGLGFKPGEYSIQIQRPIASNDLPTKEEARSQIAAQYPDFNLLSLKVRSEEKEAEIAVGWGTQVVSVTYYYLECQSAGISVRIQPPKLGFLRDHGYPE